MFDLKVGSFRRKGGAARQDRELSRDRIGRRVAAKVQAAGKVAKPSKNLEGRKGLGEDQDQGRAVAVAALQDR